MDTAALIENLLRAHSADSLLVATRNLADQDDPAAAAALVQVLGFNNPGAAVAAVEGLIRLGPAAVPALLCLDPQNYGARAWAVRALAGIGDVRGLDLLEDALGSDVAASVRRAAAKGLGHLRLDGLEPPHRRAVRERCLGALLAAVSDGEWVVRYAVAMALEGLGRQILTAEQAHHPALQDGLEALAQPAREEVLVVRLRARLAMERLEI